MMGLSLMIPLESVLRKMITEGWALSDIFRCLFVSGSNMEIEQGSHITSNSKCPCKEPFVQTHPDMSRKVLFMCPGKYCQLHKKCPFRPKKILSMFPVVHLKSAMHDAFFYFYKKTKTKNKQTANCCLCAIFLSINWTGRYTHTNNYIGRGHILFYISFPNKSETDSNIWFNK